MPKHQPNGKQPRFLQFRPLHAFTTGASDQATQNRKALWKVLWIVVLIALMFAIAIVFLQNQ